MTRVSDLIGDYDANAAELARQYESQPFEVVHADALPHLPHEPAAVLDVGAGSGRDAAWFAEHGHEVMAVEPAQGLRAEAERLHPNPNIRWLRDDLPGLERVGRSGVAFDLIWLSAVWMHVAPRHRERAFRKLASLLRAGGRMMISLRHGPAPPDRQFHEVSVDEIRKLARRFGLVVVLAKRAHDRLGREQVWWETLVLELPDDGTGAFPLLRNIIMNDDKASTYKLALLRTLVRIAEGASGLVRITPDGDARVPLGLAALYWVRGFKPLIQADFRQTPRANTNVGLGFVKRPFRALDASPYDLHVGQRFSGATGATLRLALRDAAQTITRMPAHYITYPGSTEQIFRATYGRMPCPDDYALDATFLWRYGELQVPAHIWHSLSHFAVWIEPVLIGEWIAMMRTYDGDQAAAYDRYQHALRWLDPEHDTSIVRRIVKTLQERDTPVRCVWTSTPLREDFAIDHCMPFSRWPCNDLWNLLPATKRCNTKKGDGLPSLDALRDASPRIMQWWETAYLTDRRYRDRFIIETGAALPFVEDPSEPAQVFDALALLRSNIRRDQQLPEWPA